VLAYRVEVAVTEIRVVGLPGWAVVGVDDGAGVVVDVVVGSVDDDVEDGAGLVVDVVVGTVDDDVVSVGSDATVETGNNSSGHIVF